MNEQELKKEIEELKRQLNGQEVSAKMLIRRDLELNRAYEKLQELDKLKSDFVSVVAHQLRTPLSVTKWALDMLWDISSESLTPEQIRILMRGRESNERIISIVDDLLNVDLHDVGKVQYSFNIISMSDVVNPITNQLKPLAKRREISLEVSIDNDLKKVNGDIDKLRSVLQNLLENSIKYTPKGGSVIVRAYMKDTEVVVSVKDTGIGVPKSEYEHLFSKFYRGKNAIKTITEGSGLGLFIARKIINRHGGKIWFDSDEGKGATFYFSVPVKVSN